jgi:RNA polymerase-binding transcription factor DksA
MIENQEQLKDKLIEEKNRIEMELRKIASQDSDGDYKAEFEDYGREREDNATEVENYAANIGVTESLEGELERIILALKKQENGTYGKCEKCEKDIPAKRLEVYPAARNCVECK